MKIQYHFQPMGSNFFARDLGEVSILLMFDTLSFHHQKITGSGEEKVKSNQKLKKRKWKQKYDKRQAKADSKAVLAPTAALYVTLSAIESPYSATQLFPNAKVSQQLLEISATSLLQPRITQQRNEQR